MRIASVLHDAAPEPDGAPLLSAVALERDGALYRASTLARAFGPRYAKLPGEPDFHATVIALGGDPLFELDERLKSGDRPSAARLLPGSFTWLPPCDTQRASLFVCAPYLAQDERPPLEPSFSAGSARALLGHDATVPLLCDEASLDVEGSLAVLLEDELWRATAGEAEQAILGYSLLLVWKSAPLGFCAQLGPTLVTRDEAGPIGALRTQLRVDGVPLASCRLDAWSFSPAESIAWISHHVPLYPGDVISAGRARGGCTREVGCALSFGARVDFAIERIGRLSGRPSPAPAMRAWRRRTVR